MQKSQPVAQPLSTPMPRLIAALVIAWMMFLSWLGMHPRTVDHLDRWRWLFSGRPMLHLQLAEPGHNPRIRTYEVSVRLADREPVRMEFAASDTLTQSLSLAVPGALLTGAELIEFQIAGLDEKGCILEGGEQHMGGNVALPLSSGDPVIPIVMKSLPRALCVL